MTNEELKQFKSAISITAVAQSLGVDVQNGKCRCFFPQRHSHGDRTPSVSISESYGTFRCWVCDDVRGDVISLVQLLRDCSFAEALDWLMMQYPVLVPANARRPVVTSRDGSSSRSMGLKRNVSAVNGSTANVPAANVGPVPQSTPLADPMPEKELISEDDRKKLILSFLKRLSPVDNTPAGAWLVRRKIYKPTWDKMLLRTITDYGSLSKSLREEYGVELLQHVGLFNEKGNLRFYKHPLIFPYLDTERRAFYFQARALDRETKPKELCLKGTVPFPYNLSALDGEPGWVFLCEGVVDTLSLLGQRMTAVGIPGVRSFKVSWLPLFKNKGVILSLDHDEAGRSGMEYIGNLFAQNGIRTKIFGQGLENLPGAMKEGQDINDWIGGKK